MPSTSPDQDAPRTPPGSAKPDAGDRSVVSGDAFESLPVDSDVEVADARPPARPRPVHLTWRFVGLVAFGGAIGTGAREALSLVIPAAGAFPTGIFVINLTGAFALGVVLELLLRLGSDEGRRRALRLLIGTGFMGGYTTYSTLAVGVAVTFGTGHEWVGIGYGLVSVVAGAAASVAGILVGGRLKRATERTRVGSKRAAERRHG
ncbi:fluoride efflux transporter FluC [Rathayibacter sp. CAU 1779]